MTVKELRDLIDGLEDEIEVCVTTDDTIFINACACSCGLEEIDFIENGKQIVLVLSPCEQAIEEIAMQTAEEKLFEVGKN